MKTRFWILVLAVLLLLCLGLSLYFMLPGKTAAYAQILSDGRVIHTLDLRYDRELTVTTEKGTNVITVRDGKIAVTSASCPDHVCMDRGFCGGGVQIVCLPNALVIRFLGEQEIDGAAG